MQKIIHRASTRGYADRGWLISHHTFSFADYYNPSRTHFGALRVLNDDWVAGGEGFGAHPHDNMEIVTIPLAGALRHGDNMGHSEVLGLGQAQVMTAGTGVTHSEYNASDREPAEFLQIWILSDARGHKPRYEQFDLSPEHRNSLRLIVAPEGCGSQHVGWIHQSAWMYMLHMEKGHVEQYKLRVSGQGIYLFVLEGSIAVGDEELERRDGMGVWETDEVLIKGLADARVLIIEVPMR